jgi:DAACS family dicarboxylate/amino acid:cation (Na+ or H+) symporter
MVLGLVLGTVVGLFAPSVAKHFAPAGTAFIQALKVIVVPIVFTMITLGVHDMGRKAKELGKVTTVALIYFVVAALVAILLGLALNGIFRPGLGADLTTAGKMPANFNTTVNWSKFLLDMIPSNIVAAMAGTNLLPVIVFSVALGLALAAIGERATPMVHVLDSLMTAIFKITMWIVMICPYAVFAVTAWLFATQGTKTIFSLLKLLMVSYIGYFCLLAASFIVLSAIGDRPFKVFKYVSEPILLGVGTRASETTLPLHLEKLIELGVPKGLASIVLPLAYVFNRDGSIMYGTLAVGFIMDAYHVPLTWQGLLSIVVLMEIMTKGTPNMPSGSLVTIALVLSALGLPMEAVTVIAGIDAFADMGRTGTSVFCNTVAIKVVMKICRIKYEPVALAATHAG